MKLLIAFFGVVLLAGSAFADPYSAAIQQAKRVSSQETATNQRLMKNPQPTTPPQNNPPVNPALQATLQNIESLRNDFVAIGVAANTNLVAAQRQALTNDLAAAAQDTKPQAASISKLADDLIPVIVRNEKLRGQLPKLAQYVHATFNSSHLIASQQQMIFDGVQTILTDAGASPDEIANVVNDIKTIADETK